MYQRIFVPVDGSETSNRGVKEAVRLARDQGAKLRFLHVIDQSFIPSDPGSGFYPTAVYEAVRRGAQTVIDQAMAAAAAAGLEAETRTVENFTGRVADVIIREAENWPADVIVMGTHGRRGVSHLFLGSDAEAVVRMSTVPVLLVKAAPVVTQVKEPVAA